VQPGGRKHQCRAIFCLHTRESNVYSCQRRTACAGMSFAEYEENPHYDEVDSAMTDAYGDEWADEEDAFDDEP